MMSKKWYVVHAYSGFEKSVQRALLDRIQRAGNQIDIAPTALGALVAFPANVLHQVTPIRSGVRKALVIWAVGPEFR